MPAVRVNGVDLYYETTGSGERLLLTHGSWTDGSGWEPKFEKPRDRCSKLLWMRQRQIVARAIYGHTRRIW